MNTNDSNKVIHRQSLWRHACWCRIFEQELFDTLSQVFHAEFSLGFLVTWSDENGVSVGRDVVAFSELVSKTFNGFLHISSEISCVSHERVFLNQMAH